MQTFPLVQITKSEARKRYDSGQYIAVANDRYRDGTPGAAFTQKDMDGKTFDEVAAISVDTRRPSAVYWSKPGGTADDLTAFARFLELTEADLDPAVYDATREDEHGTALSGLWEQVAFLASKNTAEDVTELLRDLARNKESAWADESRDLNLGVEFLPVTAEGHDDENRSEKPCVRFPNGTVVFTYYDTDGTLQISVDYDGPTAVRLDGPGGTLAEFSAAD